MKVAHKKQKVVKHHHPIFDNKDIMSYIVQFLPIISVLAIVRVFPYLREKNIVNADKIIDRVYMELKEKMHKDLFSLDWTYTGSLLLEVLLGETFGNEKRDVDMIRCGNNGILSKSNKFKPMEEPTPFYNNGYALVGNDSIHIDEIYLADNDEVNSFDINCCKMYVSPYALSIKFPKDLLKKTTVMNASIFLKRLYPKNPSNYNWISKMKQRLQKYHDRGFKIVVKYDDYSTVMELSHNLIFDANKYIIREIECNKYFSLQKEIQRCRMICTKWFEERPPPGLYSDVNYNT